MQKSHTWKRYSPTTNITNFNLTCFREFTVQYPVCTFVLTGGSFLLSENTAQNHLYMLIDYKLIPPCANYIPKSIPWDVCFTLALRSLRDTGWLGTNISWRKQSFMALSCCQGKTNSTLLSVLCHSQVLFHQSLVGITSNYILNFLLPITPSSCLCTQCY